MPLKPCMKLATGLSEEDTSTILSGYDTYRSSMDNDAAAKLAIEDAISNAEQEKAEYQDLIYAAHPDLVESEAVEEVADIAEPIEETLDKTTLPVWADELESVGSKIDDDGTVLLYHATTKESAEKIRKTGKMLRPKDAPDDYGIYLGSNPSVAESYGDGTVVAMRVKASDLNPDDIFPGRRMDFSVKTKGGSYTPVSIEDSLPVEKPSPPTPVIAITRNEDSISTGDFIQRGPQTEKPKKSIARESLESLVRNLQNEYKGTREISFHISDTQAETFGPNSVDENGLIKGGFYSGTNEIVLIAENIRDSKDAMSVIRHEAIGHFGMRELFNQDGQFDTLLDRVYKSRTGELKELYDWVAKVYPNLVRDNDVRKIADEMIARAAETPTKPNLIKWIYDQIINLLNQIGLARGKVSNKEMDSLVRLSAQNLRNKSSETIDPEFKDSPDILFSKVADDANDAPVGSALGMPDETLREQFVRYAQNSFNRVKKLQTTIKEQGGSVSSEADIYGVEERSSGKISYRLKQLERQRMKPLLDLMDDTGITLDELDNYLIAKHAQERNDYIASINDAMPDGGSGMTNAEAQDILDNLGENEEALSQAANIVYAVNNQNLQDLVLGGHLNQETVDKWADRWDFYIPLKGKEGETGRPGIGQGFGITGAGIKKALGRGEGNEAESPTAHSFAQAESTIVRTEKTKVGQALVQLIRENPDPAFWAIGKRTYKKFEDLFGEPFEGYEEAPEGLVENIDYHRITNSEGKVVYRLDPNYKNRDDVFGVMVEGEELLITIKDKVLMEQLKKMNVTQLNAVVAGFGTLNRYLAMINTALNPEFVITNFERDFQTAMVNLGGEHSAAIAAKVAKSIPGAIRGIWQATFDTKGQSEWRDLFNEMESEGGAIGFFGLEDIDTKVKKIQNKLSDRHGVLGKTKKGILAVRDVVLDANLSVENAARLAAYKVIRDESIANGMNEKEAKSRAASVAKNLTVNFNRKGELAPVLNSAYLFYNASIQGSARILTALGNPRVRKIVGGLTATSFALALYNREMGGDDDDEIAHWDKISDYTKQTNLIVMHPDGSGNYSKIRLPYGYNVFSYAGTVMHDMMYGKDYTPARATMNLLSAVMNAFNPIQGADLLDTITPTFLKPFEQDSRNINFMGTPIKPEFPFDDYDRPESQKAFKSTNPVLKDMMVAINEATGGDETHSGLIDISPEIIEHYVGWLTGGAGMTATRAVGTTINLASGEEIDLRNVPFARTLGGSPGTHYDTEKYYNSIEAVAAVEARLKILKGTDEWGEYKSEQSEVHKLAMHVTRYKNRIKRLRDKRDKAYADKDTSQANELREEIRQEMMQFSMKYDDAIAAQE